MKYQAEGVFTFETYAGAVAFKNAIEPMLPEPVTEPEMPDRLSYEKVAGEHTIIFAWHFAALADRTAVMEEIRGRKEDMLSGRMRWHECLHDEKKGCEGVEEEVWPEPEEVI